MDSEQRFGIQVGDFNPYEGRIVWGGANYAYGMPRHEAEKLVSKWREEAWKRRQQEMYKEGSFPDGFLTQRSVQTAFMKCDMTTPFYRAVNFSDDKGLPMETGLIPTNPFWNVYHDALEYAKERLEIPK
jgi:hypothetical protein